MKNDAHTKQGRGVVDEIAETIQKTLASFGVAVEIVEAIEGVRTYYVSLRALKPVRMKAMKAFEDDLRYALGNSKVEIEAPIPDKQLIGVMVTKMDELPPVLWSDLIASDAYTQSDGELAVPIGVDDQWNTKVLDLAKLTHVLIGGTTGSGKTNLIHVIINSLIHAHAPSHLRLIMIDPADFSFADYKGLPHLLTPVINDPKKIILALRWCTKEIERRYDVLNAAKVTNLADYHAYVAENTTGEVGEDPELLPYVVTVINEMSELMMVYPNEFESAIVRLMQKSRAVGFHLIIATQRPSVNIVTGTIKANIPTRIALPVASSYDSRTILDTNGAEKLVGPGDALVQTLDSYKPARVQIAYITPTEIRAEVQRASAAAFSGDTIDLNPSNPETDAREALWPGYEEPEDDLYDEARAIALQAGKISTSFLQRKLRLGYSRAARLIDLLEERGVITGADGSSARRVITE